MGKRNWCRVEWDGRTGELEFDIKVEREKGNGVTARWVFSGMIYSALLIPSGL